MKKKWLERLLVQSIYFTLFLFVLFFVMRLCFILSGLYHGYIGEVKGMGEYFKTLINGIRYDGKPIAFFSILYFVLGVVFFWRDLRYFVLGIYALLVVLLVTFVGLSEMVFYEIFDDVFNANLLGLFFDDQKAIFHTGISGQYGISFKVIAWIVLAFGFMWIYIKISNSLSRKYGDDPLSSIRSRLSKRDSSLGALVLFCVFVVLMILCINSAFSFRAANLNQVIKPVENNFLRKASTGGFRNLYLVYRDYAKISNSKFSDYTSQSPLEVVREYFDLEGQEEQYNLKDLLAKRVYNMTGAKIDHVFYIIAEGLSEWHFDKDFDEIGLTSGLKSLLQDNHGAKIGVFLQNGSRIIDSVDVQLTGLFQTEIPLNSMLGTLPAFITAPAVIMKHLGYKNNFYYGGSGIWQKLDQYSTSQGFEKIYYNTQIVDNAKLNGYPLPYEGLWGAYDHHLFSLVRDNVFKERSQPSFNMILTTSNHPPYDVPLEQFYVPLNEITRFFSEHSEYKVKNARLIGHIWYEDKVIAQFIHEVSRILPNSLFVITGDHYDREYPKADGSLKASNAVPLIFYSPALEIKKIANIGSHIDITPSILQLVAPNEYVYHSFGTPLVSNDNVALSEKNSALGYSIIATDRFVYGKDGHIEYFHDGIAQNDDKELAQALYKRLKQAVALSWWIAKNGYEVRD